MEVAECTRIVLDRIQQIEPENFTKIIGYLFLKHNQQEIIDYAHGPDNMIHSLVNEAKADLLSSPKPSIAAVPTLANYHPSYMHSPAISRPFSSPSSFRVGAPYWDPRLLSDQPQAFPNSDQPPPQYNGLPMGLLNNKSELLGYEEKLQSLNPLGTDFSSKYYYPEAAIGGGFGSRTGLRSPPGFLDLSPKPCHYFHRGFCKHGINCRYIHSQDHPDNLSPMRNTNMNELLNDDYVLSPGSLEKLEMEIRELLIARRGAPVSIASLPMIYHEMYGRTLQADGYLTESQRHGKVGYSLTKLLARLKSIRLIDRPHGQHSVVLAEDASKYMECRNGRSDLGAVPGSSHQIYLTFPAESTFTEEDVSEYFKQFGPVRDVRIPRQEKRMFGFVSFVFPETVKQILAKGHPHYICGARVLVKPYKEKSKINDRKYEERIEFPMYFHSPHYEMDPEQNSFPRVCGNPRLIEKQLIQDPEQALEFERRRLLELQLSPKPMAQHSYFGNGTDELKYLEDHFSSLPVLTNRSTTGENARHTSNSSSDQDSGFIELPDSPFASPR